MTIRKIGVLFVMAVAGGMLSFSSSGCGGDDPATAACNAHCDKQGQATGCSGSTDSFVSTCKQLCEMLISRLSADCATKAKAQYDCLEKQSWKCLSGGNLPQPEDPQACQAETAAFNPCLQQQ